MVQCPIEIVDKDHKVERLYIHWDILTICNYRCYYCYASHYFKEAFLYSMQHIKYILNCILKANYPVFIGLQGGEPTLHPEYGSIVSYMHERIVEANPLNKMYITTNLSKPLTFFKQSHIHKYDKCMMLVSIHPQYWTYEKLLTLESYIDFFSDTFQKVRINVMMPDNERYYDLYHSIFDILIPLKSRYTNLELHPHFIYYEAMENLYPYSDRFYDEFSYLKNIDTYIKVTYANGTYEILNDLEYFRKKLNTCVTGMRCYHNNYEIVSHFKTFNLCFRHINSDLKENPNFFKSVTIQPYICPHKSCNCDGLIKILKRRNDEFSHNST